MGKRAAIFETLTQSNPMMKLGFSQDEIMEAVYEYPPERYAVSSKQHSGVLKTAPDDSQFSRTNGKQDFLTQGDFDPHSSRRNNQDASVSVFLPSNDPAFGTVKAMEIDSLGSLKYRIVYVKGRKEVSPWHGIPLHVKSGLVSCVCTTARGSWLALEIAELEPFNPLRPVKINGKPATFSYNVPAVLGVLPQTRIYPEVEKGTDIISTLKFHSRASLSSIDGPMYVMDVGSSSRNPGEIYFVKPVGAFHLLEGSTSTWVIVAVDAADPRAEEVGDIQDVERVWPKKLSKLQRWLSTCLNIEELDHDWQDPLSLCQPRGVKSAMAAISSAHSSWQSHSQEAMQSTCEAKVGLSMASLQSSWRMYVSHEGDVSAPLSAPRAGGFKQSDSNSSQQQRRPRPLCTKVLPLQRLWKCGSDEFSHMFHNEADPPASSQGGSSHRRHASEGSEFDVFGPSEGGNAKGGEEEASAQSGFEQSLTRISTLEAGIQCLSLSSEESVIMSQDRCDSLTEEDIPVAMPVLEEARLPAATHVPHKIVSANFTDELEKWKKTKIFSRSKSDKYGERKQRRRVSFSETVEVFLFEADNAK